MSSYSIAFLDNCLIALDIKIDKMQTCLNSTHNNLFFNDRPKAATLLKKRLWQRCFPVSFAKFLGTNFFYRAHIRVTVFD